MTNHDDLQKACQEAQDAAMGLLKKSQQSFDFGGSTNPHDHHKAYSRISASGKVSQIAAKGAFSVSRRQELTDHTTRHHLANGWFVDHERKKGFSTQGNKYEVFAPGYGKNGTALFICGGDTLKQVLDTASKLNPTPTEPVSVGTFDGPARASQIEEHRAEHEKNMRNTQRILDAYRQS